MFKTSSLLSIDFPEITGFSINNIVYFPKKPSCFRSAKNKKIKYFFGFGAPFRSENPFLREGPFIVSCSTLGSVDRVLKARGGGLNKWKLLNNTNSGVDTWTARFERIGEDVY